jgi:FixJ family two-component response regulator
MSLKIFYLDDEPDLLELFSDTFSSDKIQIKTFVSVDDLIASVEKERPDIVFLDFRLGSTTGDEVAFRLPNSIPKALITGDLSVSLKNEFKAIFEKPYKIELIRDFIEAKSQTQMTKT